MESAQSGGSNIGSRTKSSVIKTPPHTQEHCNKTNTGSQLRFIVNKTCASSSRTPKRRRQYLSYYTIYQFYFWVNGGSTYGIRWPYVSFLKFFSLHFPSTIVSFTNSILLDETPKQTKYSLPSSGNPNQQVTHGSNGNFVWRFIVELSMNICYLFSFSFITLEPSSQFDLPCSAQSPDSNGA